MTETFGDYAPPAHPAEIERIRADRAAARLTCAANAKGRTKAQRRADLREMISMLGLWPSDDPSSATGTLNGTRPAAKPEYLF